MSTTTTTTVLTVAPPLSPLEPFPLFIDSKHPSHSDYFTSQIGRTLSSMKSSSTATSWKPRVSMPTKLTNYLRLRYYQYEVTFGLYMLTPMEKCILNTIIFSILTAFMYVLFFGLEPFIVRLVCRVIYYITGSVEGAKDLCS